MKIMVVYDSLGGNTEKMAKAVGEGAGSVAGAERAGRYPAFINRDLTDG